MGWAQWFSLFRPLPGQYDQKRQRTVRTTRIPAMSEPDLHHGHWAGGRRKSAWNLLLVLFVVLSIGGIWFGLFRLVSFAQEILAPQKRFNQNMSNLGEILMVIPLFFPAAVLGMMVANLRAWLIPAARAALEEEARTRGEPELAIIQRQFAIVAAIVTALMLPLSLLGAIDPFQ
jgi:hypothetical protein